MILTEKQKTDWQNVLRNFYDNEVFNYSHIERKCGIPFTLFSKFIKGKRDLTFQQLLSLTLFTDDLVKVSRNIMLSSEIPTGWKN